MSLLTCRSTNHSAGDVLDGEVVDRLLVSSIHCDNTSWAGSIHGKKNYLPLNKLQTKNNFMRGGENYTA